MTNDLMQQVPHLQLPCKVEKMVGNKWRKMGDATFDWDDGAITITFEKGGQLCYPSGMFYTTSYNNNYLNLPSPDGAYHVSFGKVGVPAKINVLVEEFAKLQENTNK